MAAATIIGKEDWINDLIAKSDAGKKNAYCPYSNFRVGAAVLTDDGGIFTGCNVENASYPVGVCAERTAICKAVSEGHQKFKAIALISDSEDYITPCGLCRQTIYEFDIKDVICAKSMPVCGKFQYQRHTIEELLPFAFGPKHLHPSQ